LIDLIKRSFDETLKRGQIHPSFRAHFVLLNHIAFLCFRIPLKCVLFKKRKGIYGSVGKLDFRTVKFLGRGSDRMKLYKPPFTIDSYVIMISIIENGHFPMPCKITSIIFY
jgi:hypothetical protein